MSYNSELQSNNLDLQAILDTVNALPEAGSGDGIDTSDATATANNIEEGKTAYVNGQKVTGTLPVSADVVWEYAISSMGDTSCLIGGENPQKQIFDEGSPVYIEVPNSEFGDATAADVASGKTFTSASGLKLTGTNTGGDDNAFETGAPFTYTVNEIEGASYGFAINSSGYYESQNKGVKSSYAICRVNLTVKEVCSVIFDVINYAESTYDYAIFGNLDSALTLSATADSSVYKSFKGEQSSSVVNVTYSNIATGTHFIDIKFIKDSSQDKNNDSVQFKIQYDYSLPDTTVEKILEAEPDLIAQNIRTGVDILGVTGTFGTAVEQATPTITVSTAGLITASSTQEAGLVEGGTVSTTKQLTTQAAQTITPSTSDQTISSGKYLTGTQTIKGDANLKATNIAEGVSIFGVTGTHSSGADLPELTNPGSASDLLSGKELIDADGNVVTGTIATKTSSNVTASGRTVTIPAGYYASQVTKSISSATQATPTISIGADGKITASSTQSTGYVSGSTKTATATLSSTHDSDFVAGNIKKGVTIFGLAGTLETASDPVLQSKTVAPSETAQTVTPDSGYDGLSSVSVSAISKTYVGSGVTKKAAQTYTPGTSNQTISSGQYLTGTQTIKGDANLVAGNIKSGTSIFGVTGTYEGSGGIDTSDATATASDIAYGVTAYANGEKITGNVVTLNPGQTGFVGSSANNTAFFDSSANTIGITVNPPVNYLLRPNSVLKTAASASLFGDATADDVTKGKTFTSEAGLTVVGTKENTGGGGNFVVTEVTLASDHSSTTGKKICNYPLTGVDMNNENLFVMLVRKDTTELTYSIPIVMACNTAYLNGSYTLALKRTSYGVSVSYKPTDANYKFNNATGQGVARIYVNSLGDIYIMSESSYSFVAGTYYLICGVL